MTPRNLSLAAALLCVATPLLAQEAGPEYVVHINEPFLSFETAGDRVTVISPEDPEGTAVQVQRLEVAGVT